MSTLETKDITSIVATVAVIAGLLFLPKLCGGDSGNETVNRRKNNTQQPSQQSSPPQSQKWYEGGTLHKATMGEWYRSSRRNRIATCADFVTNMMKVQGDTLRDMDQMRELALALEVCVSEAGADEQLHSQKASELSAACWILMEH